jgi:uncharacterized cupin superfamily protein
VSARTSGGLKAAIDDRTNVHIRRHPLKELRASSITAVSSNEHAAKRGEEVAVSFTLAHREDCEKNGTWELVRRTLGLKAFGLNVVEIPAGEQIPEHDETSRDQEEIFLVLSGSPTLVIDGEDHATREGMFARLDPEHSRTVRNDGAVPASVLIASAPRSSGYEPMSWA